MQEKAGAPESLVCAKLIRKVYGAGRAEELSGKLVYGEVTEATQNAAVDAVCDSTARSVAATPLTTAAGRSPRPFISAKPSKNAFWN
jgi:hypothetical protein